jgi:hypothetical protein
MNKETIFIVSHVSKKPRRQQQRAGEEKSTAASRGWGNVIRESLNNLVGSAMDASVNNNALA